MSKESFGRQVLRALARDLPAARPPTSASTTGKVGFWRRVLNELARR